MSVSTRNTKFFSKLLTKKKHRNSQSMERSSSNQVPKREVTMSVSDKFATLPYHRGRAHTVGNGTELSRPNVNKRSCSSAAVLNHGHSIAGDISYTSKEMDVTLTLASPRHFLRRGGMVQDQLQDHLYSSKLAQQSFEEDSDQVTVCFEQDMNKMRDTAVTKDTQSLRDILEFLCIKHNLFADDDLDSCHITATRSGSPVPVNLDNPSSDYAACVVEIKSTNRDRDSTDREKISMFQTVQDCLSFFNVHGLEELPLPLGEDEDSYRLPRVQQMDPIVQSWADLPISAEEKKALSKKELEQQQAIWEFIYTEYSHLRNLDIIINIFMRCLELIRRAKLLTEDSYHNVFGYIEYIYNAHERFWTYTLEPCLEKVYESHKPLDLGLIFDRFPEEFGTHFEIYEQHCALEKINLTNLNKAMSNPDFMAYLKWCEARPECNRLDLKSYLAMPMQRLTKYPLLISAISKKTADPAIKQRLNQIWHNVHAFVDQVNSGVQAQEESERVKDAMNRICSYHVVDIPSEIKDVVNQYTHLDLLAPMPDVEVDKQRVLIVEGSLKHRDHSNTRMVVHIFLFTDILLVTKPQRKGGDKFTVVRAPYKIASLVLRPLEPESFLVIELNDFGVLTSWFILKAHTADIAKKWMEHINSAQQIYTEAVERKAQNWNYLQTLRSERILNGIDHSEALSSSLSNSLWSINNLSGMRMRNSMSSSNESLMLQRGSTPSFKNHYLPMSRTMSVGLSSEANGQHMFQSPQRLNGFSDFGSNPSLYQDPCVMDKLALERTSSLGRLMERPYREHNMTMKTISETQLGGSMFSDEDFGLDHEAGSRNLTPAVAHASEEQSSMDDSLMSDDCSTQSSTDTQITSSEIIDAAVTASLGTTPSSPQRFHKSLSSSPCHKLSPTRSPNISPNISPLHRKLQTSLSSDSREGVYRATISPTLLAAPNSSPSHLKSILRSPTTSITSLSSLSPTHSATSEQRVSIQTSSMPSTPTSTSSADRTHSVLMESSGVGVSHTIVPTNNLDTPKNGKSPSPSPSMDLEVVACKTVVEEEQWQRGRSQSDTTNNRGGLQFHVTFVKDEDVLKKSHDISPLFEVHAALEADNGLLDSSNHTPLPIIRQASDSLLMSSQRQAATGGRQHKVMFSECTQVLSFDSELTDCDEMEEKIRIVHDDLSVIDLANPEPNQNPTIVDATESVAEGRDDTPGSPSHECAKVSDKVEPAEPLVAESQSIAFLPDHASTQDGVETVKSKVEEKKVESLKKNLENHKTVSSPTTHKRVSGKNVRQLSQMFEGAPSSEKVAKKRTTAVQQTSRKVSTSKIPVVSELIASTSTHTKTVANSLEGRNNVKSPNLSATHPPAKVAAKTAKPSNTARRKVSTTGTERSPATVKKVAAPARKNSVAQQKAAVGTKSATPTATRRVSRVENTPMTKYTSSPVIGSRKQPTQKDSPSTPKLKSSRSQVTSSGRDSPSTSRQGRSNDLTPPRSKLQRQPAAVTSRSPSPFSSGQATHKPLSRLSGTRQPLRRKGGSNNSSPAAARKSNEATKSAVIELNGNNSNNNNNVDSCGGEGYGLFNSPSITPRVHRGLSPVTALLSQSRRSESFQCLSPSSLQKSVRFDIGDVADLASSSEPQSIHDCSNSPPPDSSASRSNQVTLQRARSNPNPECRSATKSKDNHNYRHSLHASILRHSRKRSPLEWQHFALSWSSPNLAAAGSHPGLGSKRL